MKRMERDQSTKQQIEQFRKKQNKEIEKRKSVFEKKVKLKRNNHKI